MVCGSQGECWSILAQLLTTSWSRTGVFFLLTVPDEDGHLRILSSCPSTVCTVTMVTEERKRLWDFLLLPLCSTVKCQDLYIKWRCCAPVHLCSCMHSYNCAIKSSSQLAQAWEKGWFGVKWHSGFPQAMVSCHMWACACDHVFPYVIKYAAFVASSIVM